MIQTALQRRQAAVDGAIALLVLEVRDALPVGASVLVRSGRGEMSGEVCGPAQARRGLVQVLVQPDTTPGSVRQPRPRWFDYRIVRVAP